MKIVTCVCELIHELFKYATIIMYYVIAWPYVKEVSIVS